jgi:hypothetical protein
MKVLKYLWIAVILISSIWLLINIMSVIGYSITNTYDVVHAKRSIGETAEILKRDKEIKDLVTHHIFLIATNIFMIITAFFSIRKLKKYK